MQIYFVNDLHHVTDHRNRGTIFRFRCNGSICSFLGKKKMITFDPKLEFFN